MEPNMPLPPPPPPPSIRPPQPPSLSPLSPPQADKKTLSDNSLLIPMGILVFLLMILVIYLFIPSDEPVDVHVTKDLAVPAIPAVTLVSPQRELGYTAPRFISKPPYFNEFDAEGLSPHENALEVGKTYFSTFISHVPAGGTTDLRVTIKRAAKYYPIKTNEWQGGLVYFPSCTEHACFDGKSFPMNVSATNAIIAIDLEFKNSTKNTVYLRGNWYARFKVGEEYIIPKGSVVTQNISTLSTERFTSAPSNYIGPQDTQTYTFWVEVPHDQLAATFMYGGNKDPNDISFNDVNPSLNIPLTFGGRVSGIPQGNVTVAGSNSLITVLYPNGGETVKKGGLYKIKWHVANFESLSRFVADKTRINMSLSSDDTPSVSHYIADIPLSGLKDESLDWNVSNEIVSGNYRLRMNIYGTDPAFAADKLWGSVDLSDDVFTVAP